MKEVFVGKSNRDEGAIISEGQRDNGMNVGRTVKWPESLLFDLFICSHHVIMQLLQMKSNMTFEIVLFFSNIQKKDEK